MLSFTNLSLSSAAPKDWWVQTGGEGPDVVPGGGSTLEGSSRAALGISCPCGQGVRGEAILLRSFCTFLSKEKVARGVGHQRERERDGSFVTVLAGRNGGRGSRFILCSFVMQPEDQPGDCLTLYWLCYLPYGVCMGSRGCPGVSLQVSGPSVASLSPPAS